MKADAVPEPNCLIAVGMSKSQNNRDWEMILNQKQEGEIMRVRGKVGVTVGGMISGKAMEMTDRTSSLQGKEVGSHKYMFVCMCSCACGCVCLHVTVGRPELVLGVFCLDQLIF